MTGSTHLHFGIISTDPISTFPVLRIPGHGPISSIDGHGEVAFPEQAGLMIGGEVFLDRGSWEVWGESAEFARGSLHVVASWTEPPHRAQALQASWVLQAMVGEVSRVVDAAILTDAEDWSLVHATYLFNGPDPSGCYVIDQPLRSTL